MKQGRRSTGHPVDVGSGAESTAWHDAEIFGHISLVWRRFYSTDLLDVRPGPLGKGWVHNFDMTLARDVDGFRFFGPDGCEVEFDDPDGAMNRGGGILNLGEFMEIRREGDNYVVYHWHDWETEVNRFVFRMSDDATMPLGWVELPSGHRITLSYDSGGRLVEARQSIEGRGFLLEYQRNGLLSRLLLASPISDPEELARYEYDDQNRLAFVYDAAGTPIQYSYDGEGRLIEEVSRSGAVYRMKYESTGRCVEATGINNYGLRRFRYDDARRITEVTDSLGHVTFYHLNDRGQVEREVLPNGLVLTRQFDEFGRMASETGSPDGSVRYSYNARGDLAEAATAAGSATRFEYDEHHQPTVISEADGAKWQLRYDRGAVVALVDPSNVETVFVRDADNVIKEIRTPSANIVSVSHNRAWSEEIYSDEIGVIAILRYDHRLELIAYNDAQGTVRQFEHDRTGEVSAVIEADGSVSRVVRDAAGNAVQYTDANGSSTRMEYTTYCDCVRMTDPNGLIYQYAWDTEGRLIAITNPRGETATTEYDAGGNVTRERFFDGREEVSEYNEEGRLARQTRADGTVLTYDYDDAGNLIRVSSPAGLLVRYKYDAVGQMVEAVTRDATVTFEHDLCGRLTAEVEDDLRVEYSYQPDGDLASRDFEGALVSPLRFTYDKRGRLISIGGANDRTYQTYEYNAADLLITRVLGPARESFEYDSRGRTKRQRVARANRQELLSRSFDYDAEDNLTRVADSLRGETRYEYDADQQLIRATDSVRGAVSYRYDECGNLISKGTTPLGYGPGNRLVRNGSAQYQRDANGNLVAATAGGETTRFVWDDLDQLTTILHPDGSRTSYAYDGLGRRVSKTRAGKTTRFYWADDSLLCEKSDTDTVDYAIGDYTPEIIWQNGVIRYVICSHVVMPFELLDERGELVWRGEYDEWGLLIRGLPQNAGSNTRLPGQYCDAESGLHYNRYRYYSPLDGQFISPDPIGLLGGLNEFSYGPNPVNWFDPLGLYCGKKSCKNSVYVLTKKVGKQRKIVYIGITMQKAKARKGQHAQVKNFSNMYVIKKGLTRRGARNIEGSALYHFGKGNIAGITKKQVLNKRRKDKGFYHSYKPGVSGGGRKLLTAAQVTNALDLSKATLIK